MGKQYKKEVKRIRRKRYLKRKKEAAKSLGVLQKKKVATATAKKAAKKPAASKPAKKAAPADEAPANTGQEETAEEEASQAS